MADTIADGVSGKVVIRHIGTLLSGDIDRPLLDADTLVVTDGVITAVGREADCDLAGAATTIDARRTTVVVHALSRDEQQRAKEFLASRGGEVTATL
jgi:enamidase